MKQKRSLVGSCLAVLVSLTLGAMVAGAASPDSEPGADRASIVATTEVLGALVRDLVGDGAEVHTLMGGGSDPHTWQPSARDSELVFDADLVVANGLGLEEGLIGVLEQAEADGVAVFHAADHVALRPPGDGHEDDGEHGADQGHDDHEHAEGDPHIWLDPLAMRDVVLALGPVLLDAGVDVGDRADSAAADLVSLDAELAGILAVVPDEQRRLVTGHQALGYFADRYGFEVIGTVIPGLSTADEPSARELATLVEAIRSTGVPAIFTDVGTPPAVAAVVAQETGARIVELHVEQLPESGSYADLMREIASAVADALGNGIQP